VISNRQDAKKNKKRSKKRWSGRRSRPEARLVQFEEKRRTATRPLAGGEVRIGRDPTSDLIVDYAAVSRHHAVVRPMGDRSVILDVGSTNGVQVNGDPIGGKPHLLEQGDLIELTDQVVLLYEEGPFVSSTPWGVTAVAMLVLLAAAVGLYFSMRPPPAGAKAGAVEATDSVVEGSRAVPRFSREEETRETEEPEAARAGTHPRMPLTGTPESAPGAADSRVSRGGWYALPPLEAAGWSLPGPVRQRAGSEGDPA
jgi:pSer/pThr/pTyr-binding forkhead associated (FHA) protein